MGDRPLPGHSWQAFIPVKTGTGNGLTITERYLLFPLSNTPVQAGAGERLR